jgi:ABC-2 type transport system ATP-binding protein
MDATVTIDGLHKRFGGKSTTRRVILGRSLRNPLCHVAPQPGRSGRNHLLWLAHSQGRKAGRVDEVIALTGIQAAARRKAGGYSLGMRQRLGIAATLLDDPPVLIFDEPYNGMDPEGIVWTKDFLRSLAAQDRTVLVSSHLIVIGRGRVIADAMTALAGAGAEVTASGPGVLTVSGLSSERVVAILTGHAISVSEVSAHRATLEQAYLELTSRSVDYRGQATS